STATTPSGGGDVSSNPDYKAGLKMIAASDCLTCHEVAAKKIGPAYEEVADKYAGVDTAVDYLAHKVIHGGSGVWGNVPMTPHPNLTLDSAKQMVKYVLLLKTKSTNDKNIFSCWYCLLFTCMHISNFNKQ